MFFSGNGSEQNWYDNKALLVIVFNLGGSRRGIIAFDEIDE